MTLGASLALGIIVVVVAILYFVFASFLFGAGYQPTPRRVVDRMLEFAQVGPEDRIVDLGAGTGAIIFRASREHAAQAVGVEIEPLRVLVLWLRARRTQGRVTVRWGNLFGQDLSRATVVAVFLWPEAMRRLRPIFESQLPVGARIVSYYHPLPDWPVERQDDALKVYLYRKPAAG